MSLFRENVRLSGRHTASASRPGPPAVHFDLFSPARTPQRGHPAGCTSPTWRCWTAEPAVWSRIPAVLAGNSPVYGPGWKSPPFVAQRVAGKPGLFLPGRTVYFYYSSQGCSGMTLYGYARVSVREPEDKTWPGAGRQPPRLGEEAVAVGFRQECRNATFSPPLTHRPIPRGSQEGAQDAQRQGKGRHPDQGGVMYCRQSCIPQPGFCITDLPRTGRP